MAVNISDRLAWFRSHLRVWLALSCSSLLLLIPRVMSVVVFFWPLIVSTALFVAAILTVSGSSAASAGAAVPLELEDHALTAGRGDEEGESSFSVEESCTAPDSYRSLLECVKEQHEGGLMLFHSMFDRELKDGESPAKSASEELKNGESPVKSAAGEFKNCKNAGKSAAGELKDGENLVKSAAAAGELKNGENPPESVDAARTTQNGEELEDAESRPEHRTAGP